MRTLLVATTNPGKRREIRALMADAPVRLVSLADLPPIEEPEETGTTFEENARLKARYYAARSGLWTVAEDSGLVIDALGGEPGVLSARFLRPDATYQARFAEIYRRLDARADQPRSARFVAALACVDGGDVVYETTGIVEGEIARAPRGSGGFGYDPIFFYPPYGQTLAAVSEADKIAVAHRGIAFRAFAAWIIERLKYEGP
jgi:XTP/dITP diphosphohydrolase